MNLYLCFSKSKMCTPSAAGSVTIARPCESTAMLYGRIIMRYSGSPATTFSTRVQNFGLPSTSFSVAKARSKVSFRPPSSSKSGGAGTALASALLAARAGLPDRRTIGKKTTGKKTIGRRTIGGKTTGGRTLQTIFQQPEPTRPKTP